MALEPNFEGEVMKMPTESNNNPIAPSQAPIKKNLLIMLIGLLVLVGGLMAYWYFVLSVPPKVTEIPTRPPLENNAEPETPTATAQTESFGAMSTSDEINAIEADIESTNLDSLDAEMMQIDAELNAAASE
jgi:cytoskeletal protein RodZ